MTQFLLDTNVVIWLSKDEPRIARLKQLLLSIETDVFISVVTWWEIAIKLKTGKISIDLEQLRHYAYTCDFKDLPVTGKYIKAYLELPALHKDPFDHMLLAQAISSPMRLITGDAFLAKYSSLVMVV